MNEFVKKKIIATKCIAPIINENEETKRPGIYLFERTDENGITFFYCGQAVNVFNRVVSHWNGYQRIDKSIRKRGFKNEENPYGWSFKVLEYCEKERLDELEQFHILQNMQSGKQTYNLTYGSQGVGKIVLDDHRPAKGYHDGLKQGEKNAKRFVAALFSKHLDFVPKKQPPTKLQVRAMEKFEEFLKEDE